MFDATAEQRPNGFPPGLDNVERLSWSSTLTFFHVEKQLHWQTRAEGTEPLSEEKTAYLISCSGKEPNSNTTSYRHGSISA